MIKKIIIFNIILLIIILLDRNIATVIFINNAVCINQNNKITSFGSFDKNKGKNGVWIFLDSLDNISLKGTFKNNIKEGEWIIYKNNIIREKAFFKNDSICGASKNFDENGTLKDIIFHYGDDYFGISPFDNKSGAIVEWVSDESKNEFLNEINLVNKIYNEEYGNKNDDPFNHKDVDFDTAMHVIAKMTEIFKPSYNYNPNEYFINNDKCFLINPFVYYINITNYILISILIISNIVIFIIKK